MNLLSTNTVINVEVCLKHKTRRLQEDEQLLQPVLKVYIAKHRPKLNVPIQVNLTESAGPNEMLESIDFVLLSCDARRTDKHLSEDDLHHLVFYFYYPHGREMEMEMFDAEAEGDGEAVPSSNHWVLPSRQFIDTWDHLIYDNGLKEKLLKYAISALTFSQHNVNQNIIACNRLILLHGPPGTGKTTLCKALAQKLAIRTRQTYRHTHLIEINSHSLFSKWFSESGKLVMRLFAKIRELVMDSHNLICVLIDEVESLAYARNNMSGQEPKDAMRVVNALLTQLDSIKERPNVLILATSNLAETIDLAFLDRADIKQYVGLPSSAAILHIYESMFHELMRVGIIRQQSLREEEKHEGLLLELTKRSEGLSGRTLRKLPFLAHAEHTAEERFNANEKIWLSEFLDAMLFALEKYQKDEEAIQKNRTD